MEVNPDQHGLRQPAMAVAVAFIVGILADRFGSLPWRVWLMLAGVAAVGWLICFTTRRYGSAGCLLLLCCAAAGGARHHQLWSLVAGNDLSGYARSEPQLVRLTGVIVTSPRIRRADGEQWRAAVPMIDRSHCMLAARTIETNNGSIPVSGRVRLTVSGHLLHVAAGDEIEAVGHLRVPSAPGNPGQFDFRRYLRRRQCRSLLFVNHPAGVIKRRDGHALRPARVLDRFRGAAELLCVSHLSEENVPLASALLLGDRSQMTDDIRTSFAESGTAHILSISGMHVAILALWILAGCRLLGVSPGGTAWMVIGCVVLYAAISGGNPPVLRATVFILIGVGGHLLKRPAAAMNTLALSAVAVLTWNPSDLFDVGTQLSFLAVTGIILAQQWQSPPASEDAGQTERPADVAPLPTSEWRRRLRALGGWLMRGYAIMLGIWLLTLPLTAARFHLASPVGFLINVLLTPLVGLLLGSGFAFLLIGMLVPFAAGPLGIFFDWQLSGFLAIVGGSADFHLGHLYVTGPGTGWLIGYYLLAACVVMALLLRLAPRRAVQALLIWMIVGLLVGLAPPHREGLRVTVLDMGHGGSVLLELPGGKTLLYDAGMLANAARAQRNVQNAIWARGVSRIDAVVVSHADVDHFNGLHGLLGRVPVGSMLFAQSFLDFDQQSVRELCNIVGREHIPVRLLQAGDRVAADEDVTLHVLQPAGSRQFDDDNENSLVLLVEYAGRRFLLTGDLEGDGMQRLLSTPPRVVDVLLSPHHGSRAANPPELAAWADPRWVVAAERKDRVLPYLKETYGPRARLLLTGQSGAVTFSVHPDGTMTAATMRE